MKIYLLGLTLLTSLSLTSIGSHCQNLADIAKKERARREAVKYSSRVYTDADLDKYKEPSEDVERTKEFKPPQLLESTNSGTQTTRSESDEERAWSGRFV